MGGLRSRGGGRINQCRLTRVGVGKKVLILPCSVLWLSTPKLWPWKRQIIAWVFVFLTGGMSIFAAIARFIIIYPKVLRDENASIVNTYELWALIEITTCQMAVCLPALRVYLRSYQTKNMGQSWNMSRTDKMPEVVSCRASSVGDVGEMTHENSSFQELCGVHQIHEEG